MSSSMYLCRPDNSPVFVDTFLSRIHKIIKRKNGKKKSALIIWLIFFLFLQTKPGFCSLFARSQGWTFLPFLFQSLQCLEEGYQLIYFLDFKVAKWAVSSLTHSLNTFRVLYSVHMFIQYSWFKYCIILSTAEFLVISAETAFWERK